MKLGLIFNNSFSNKMKKLLIIASLIIGCDDLVEDEGICVLKHMETNLHNCHPSTTQSQCITYFWVLG